MARDDSMGPRGGQQSAATIDRKRKGSLACTKVTSGCLFPRRQGVTGMNPSGFPVFVDRAYSVFW